MMQTNDINAKQKQSELVGLLKAGDAAHMWARRADSVRALITLVSLAIAIVAAFRSDLGDRLAVAGAVGVVINEIVRRLGTVRWTRQGMLFQELFDTTAFALPWRATIGLAPSAEDRHYWEARFRGDARRKQNWYVDVAGLPRGHAILICQRENLSWDARLRALWGSALVAAGITWVLVGFIVGVLGEWRVWDLLVRWLAPSAPALVLAFTSGSRHLDVARAKGALIERVEDLLGSVPVRSMKAQKPLLNQAREIQDEIAHLRSEETRVPDLVYGYFRTKDEKAAASAAEYWRDRLMDETAKTPEQADANDSGQSGKSAPPEPSTFPS